MPALNTLDLLLIALALAGAVGGYKLGFVARVVSWAGMAVGFVLGVRALPTVLRILEDGAPAQMLLVAMATLLGAAFIGQALGLLLGNLAHLALPAGGARAVDRAAGAVAGVAGVAVAFWLLLPIAADVRGWFAEQSRTSALAGVVDRRFPTPPDTLATLRHLIEEGQFPRVFDALRPAPALGPPPPEAALQPGVAERVSASVVRVQGIACRRVQEGSGFVVGGDLVVTNAHVVAGEPETVLFRDDGSSARARVVAFDPRRDLAVLSAPGIDRPPLPLGDIGEGGRGAVFGHPGGGPLRIAPFEVGREVRATGMDIYDAQRAERQVLILAAHLAPGDSGGALVDPAGRVVGVAFAIAPDRAGVAYALAIEELHAVLQGDLTTPVDAGACLR